MTSGLNQERPEQQRTPLQVDPDISTWYNETGRPLASRAWLEAHHTAKLPERTAFARRIAEMRPTRIVDLGCADGLWLELLNDYVQSTCEFVGIDSDSGAIANARRRAGNWVRRSSFETLDIEVEAESIPPAEVTLAFNIFPYIRNLPAFLATLAHRDPRGSLIIRQYDGGTIRLGPLADNVRLAMDQSLADSVLTSVQFRHYDLDRTYSAISQSSFSNRHLEFETFFRFAPYDNNVLPYLRGTIDWTENLLSDASARDLREWALHATGLSYILENDLIAFLS